MFKIGDEVEIIWNTYAMFKKCGYCGTATVGDKGKILHRRVPERQVMLKMESGIISDWIPFEAVKLVKSTKTPHPHAELIKQWADDDSLEFEGRGSYTGGVWQLCHTPSWNPKNEYRIKPKGVRVDKEFVEKADDKTLLELLMHELMHRITQEKMKK